MRKRKFLAAALATITALALSVNAYANTQKDYTSEFGNVTSENNTIMGYGEKLVCLSTETDRIAGTHIIKYNITQSPSGISIMPQTQTLVNINMYTPYKSSETVELHHFKNDWKGGRYDGFVNTKITTYSTHEVRGNTAYACYMSSTL